MKMRTMALAFGLTAALLFGAIAAACGGGGGGSLTLEEYFTRLEEADQEYSDRSAEIDEESIQAEDEEYLSEYLPQYLEAFGNFIDSLDDINPPSEVEEEHEAVVTAANDLRGLLSTALEDSETLDEFFDATLEEDFTSAEDAVFENCTAIQDYADEEGFDAELDC